MFSVSILPSADEPVGAVDWAVITQSGPLPLFSLTFGSSPLSTERSSQPRTLIDCISSYLVDSNILGRGGRSTEGVYLGKSSITIL